MTDALTMTGKADIIDRLSAACVGQPAEIGWPHYVLHDAIKEIETLRTALADMTRQRDEAILMCELAQDKQNELLDTIERTRRQRDEARAEGFASGLEAAVKVAEVNSQSNNPYISGLALRIANGIRALAEGAKP